MTTLAHKSDLFSHAEQAEARKRAGMKLALVAQNEKAPEWAELAYRAIVALATRQAQIHVDDLLREFEAKPDHPNAWGSVWQRAIRDDVIVHSGRVRKCLADPKKNAHQYPIYQSLLYREENT
jgi:hypothetical protein